MSNTFDLNPGVYGPLLAAIAGDVESAVEEVEEEEAPKKAKRTYTRKTTTPVRELGTGTSDDDDMDDLLG